MIYNRDALPLPFERDLKLSSTARDVLMTSSCAARETHVTSSPASHPPQEPCRSGAPDADVNGQMLLSKEVQ